MCSFSLTAISRMSTNTLTSTCSGRVDSVRSGDAGVHKTAAISTKRLKTTKKGKDDDGEGDKEQDRNSATGSCFTKAEAASDTKRTKKRRAQAERELPKKQDVVIIDDINEDADEERTPSSAVAAADGAAAAADGAAAPAGGAAAATAFAAASDGTGAAASGAAASGAAVAAAVILVRMQFYKKVECGATFLRVFPNRKHQNRKDGFGCASLSPMMLGPVHHGQPGLPPSLNLENFFQGSKCYPCEMVDGAPSAAFYSSRLRMYNDAEPHRHKFKGKDRPAYFVWLDKATGKEHHLNYIQSRQFYCVFYERLATKQQDFAKLKARHQQGEQLAICGFDAFPIPQLTAKGIEAAYLDPAHPFGHERVLLALLLLPPDQLPWNKHKTFDF